MKKWEHKDIIGHDLNVGDFVICSQSSRIILGRITKLHASRTVTIQPNGEDSNGRRMGPPLRQLKRYDYNIFAVHEEDVVMGALRGYLIDTGAFPKE
jgi:hypothetical protein